MPLQLSAAACWAGRRHSEGQRGGLILVAAWLQEAAAFREAIRSLPDEDPAESSSWHRESKWQRSSKAAPAGVRTAGAAAAATPKSLVGTNCKTWMAAALRAASRLEWTGKRRAWTAYPCGSASSYAVLLTPLFLARKIIVVYREQLAQEQHCSCAQGLLLLQPWMHRHLAAACSH